MRKNALGGLLLLVTLAICCVAQTQPQPFGPDDVPSYVYLAKSEKLSGKPSFGDGALTLELNENKDKAQLCYRKNFKMVGTRVEGESIGPWTLDTLLAKSDGGGQDDRQESVKIACQRLCMSGCVGIEPDSPLVRAVTTYRGLSPVAGKTTNFGGWDYSNVRYLDRNLPDFEKLWLTFDLLTYREPNKETIGESTLIVPGSVALRAYEVKPLSTEPQSGSPNEAVNMLCLQPLDKTDKVLEETIWYWSTGPATGQPLLSVDPNASRESKVPNGCIKYDRTFSHEYIEGATLNDKVIWVATGAGKGTTIKLDNLRFESGGSGHDHQAR